MNIRDDQWEKIKPLLLGKKGEAGAHARDNRLFIDAVLWHISTQCNWGDLPSKFGKWNTTYMRFKRWNEGGVWHQLEEELRDIPELCEIIKKIAVYGDQRSQQIKQKAARKSTRKIYRESIKAAKESSKKSISEDESTLHWLSLFDGIHAV
ncbi:transposase [Collimonas arenae]|uniref:transposase n=1 Tax=Collimonas arenae TaxID=279058 RepID=UPI000690B105|nr:transposase [Collimonas arenae]